MWDIEDVRSVGNGYGNQAVDRLIERSLDSRGL